MHVATPEENSYIEAFHSILEHDVIERNVVDSYYESAGRSRERNARALFSHYNRTGTPAAPAKPFDWLRNTPAKMGRSAGSLRHNLFKKSVQLTGG
ncbi:hypothetical protein [Spirosoma utsteinense]|uniref:Transposase n=1 Tax=Spirosoma utsteinense TaxID=2585773 RepID=A0ABR6W5D9_9BACT|nr:hypothetical protein [Spirosoma utsteinense]MBC3785655.1 hypothetical protein [Spirosoma utsteinense]MBC3791806.1 hypothetical protein [Spirosoma utsteinense]